MSTRIKCIPVLPFAIFVILFSSFTYSQEITVFDGYYIDTVKVKKSVVDDLMASSIAFKNWEKANKYSDYAWICFGGQIGFGIWFFASESNNYSGDRHNIVPIIGFGVFTIAAQVFSKISFSNRKKAILQYNQALENHYFGLVLTGNGPTICYKF